MMRWRAGLLVGLGALAWAAWDTGADPLRFLRGAPWMLDFVRRSLPPDLRVLRPALEGAFKTFEIALLGTAAAAALAVPLGFLSARNVTPPAVFYPARAALNLLRSIDTLVYALLFVAAVGLGPFPGVLAGSGRVCRPGAAAPQRLLRCARASGGPRRAAALAPLVAVAGPVLRSADRRGRGAVVRRHRVMAGVVHAHDGVDGVGLRHRE